jgi:hypothetical protein
MEYTPIKLNPNFRIRIGAFSWNLPVTLRCSGIFRHGDEMVEWFSEIVVPITPVIPTFWEFECYYDEIIALTVAPVNGIGPQTSIYICADIVAGSQADYHLVKNLCCGFCTFLAPACWPPSTYKFPENAELPYIIRNIVPAAGADAVCAFAFPQHFKLIGLRATFTASAVVANRYLFLVVESLAGLEVQRVQSGTAIVALGVRNASYGSLVPGVIDLTGRTLFGGFDLWIPSNCQVRLGAQNIQAADQFADVYFYFNAVPHY